MKHLIIRIAALGVVVALGLIAIAQAQRGSGNQQPPAELSTDFAEPSADADAVRRGLVASKSETNPLRGTAPPPANAEEPAERPTGDRPMGDPFARRTAEPLSTGGAPVGRMVLGDSGIPDVNEAGMPTLRLTADDSRYGQPIPAVESAEPRELAAVTDNAMPAASQRYPQMPSTLPSYGEPAAFAADPRMSAINESEPGTAPVGGLAAPQNPARGGNFARPPTDAVTSIDSDPAGEGTGKPGSAQLEGPQSPHLTLEKAVPQQIQVGKSAVFKVTVRNTGAVAATEVLIRDQVPQGTRLLATTPRASRGTRGELVWELGTLKPGEQTTVEIELMPTAEGEIGSVATIQFNAAVSARSVSTRPELAVKTSAPDRVLIGEEVTVTITVSNPGSGTATGVVLEEHIPQGLQHPAGGDLEYEIGDLPPGESRKLELTMVASRSGPVTNVLVARGEGNLRVEDRFNLEVVAPKLEVSMAGPKRRYLEREATYRLSVHNPGTAPAEQVELVAYLPSGLKFVSANNAGHYDEANQAVFWRLEELPTEDTGTVELVTMPVEAGQQNIRLRGSAQKGLSVEREQPVLVEGIAAILFEAIDVNDPIEVGGETTYEIRVLNQGSKAATNLRLEVMLPPELQPVAAEGPSHNRVEGNRVVFEDLPRLAPKADTTYHVRAKALRPGDLRTRVQLFTGEMAGPVTKEESTRVYSDE